MVSDLCVPAISSASEPPSPRGPWLFQGSLRLASSLTPSSAASLGPSLRLPVSRLYEGALPYGTLLAGSETFPLSFHRWSVPPCHPPSTPGMPTGACIQFFPDGYSLRPVVTGSAIPFPRFALSTLAGSWWEPYFEAQ